MSEEKQRTPKSGYDLAQLLDCDRHEGVVVAVFPSVVDEVLTQEVPYVDKKGDRFHVVLAVAGPWGERLMDLQSPNDLRVKWWRVKEAAHVLRLDLVPVRWQGPIQEIPQQYFENGYVLGIRFVNHGPWFFPLEQAKLRTDSALLEAANGGATAEVDQPQVYAG